MKHYEINFEKNKRKGNIGLYFPSPHIFKSSHKIGYLCLFSATIIIIIVQ